MTFLLFQLSGFICVCGGDAYPIRVLGTGAHERRQIPPKKQKNPPFFVRVCEKGWVRQACSAEGEAPRGCFECTGWQEPLLSLT